MEQEKKKKKFSWWPFFWWFEIARYITRHVTGWNWNDFFYYAILLLPALPVYYLSTWLVKKKFDFFADFKQKPLLWYGIGVFYFLGCLILQKSLTLSACLIVSAWPLFQHLGASLYECRLRWKILMFAVGLTGMITLQNNIILLLFLTCFTTVAFKCVYYDKFFER